MNMNVIRIIKNIFFDNSELNVPGDEYKRTKDKISQRTQGEKLIK